MDKPTLPNGTKAARAGASKSASILASAATTLELYWPDDPQAKKLIKELNARTEQLHLASQGTDSD